MPPQRPSAWLTWRFAIGVALVHLLLAVAAAQVLLQPGPRWLAAFEISGTPLPPLSRLAWDVSFWLRRLLPLAVLGTAVAAIADAVVAARFYRDSSRGAAWLWFWVVVVVEVALTAAWFAAAFVLPRREL